MDLSSWEEKFQGQLPAQYESGGKGCLHRRLVGLQPTGTQRSHHAARCWLGAGSVLEDQSSRD